MVSGGSMNGHVSLYFTPHFPQRKKYKARQGKDPAKVALLFNRWDRDLDQQAVSLAHGAEIDRKTHFAINTLLLISLMANLFSYFFPLGLRLRQHFSFVFHLLFPCPCWSWELWGEAPVQYFRVCRVCDWQVNCQRSWTACIVDGPTHGGDPMEVRETAEKNMKVVIHSRHLGAHFMNRRPAVMTYYMKCIFWY